GKLRIALTTHGGTDSDIGTTGDGRNRLLINHPALVDGTPRITVMQAIVTVNSATAEDCTASDTATRTRAQLLAFFFNDGTGNTVPGNLKGDIVAGIQMQRDSRTGDAIVAFLSRCSNAACAPATLLKSAVFTRTWATGAAELLTVKWQPANDRVVFTAKSGGQHRDRSSRTTTSRLPTAALRRVSSRISVSPTACRTAARGRWLPPWTRISIP
ncbi:MAG: hypothetical protein WED01_15305, partial [Candidatus Rokuibacteriota bacterium]